MASHCVGYFKYLGQHVGFFSRITPVFQERRKVMKSSLIVVAFFCIGCLVGIFNDFQFDMHNLSMYILYALMLQVGISIGSNKNLKFLIKSLRPNMLLVADSYHCRNSSFFSFCQFIAESVDVYSIVWR